MYSYGDEMRRKVRARWCVVLFYVARVELAARDVAVRDVVTMTFK